MPSPSMLIRGLLGEGGAVQQKIHHGIQVALLKTRANARVLAAEPKRANWPDLRFGVRRGERFADRLGSALTSA